MIAEAAIRFGGLHFLVVDDQKFVRHFVSQNLMSVGVRDISIANSGAEAIDQIRTIATVHNELNSRVSDVPFKPGDISRQCGNFDCVIVDFNMQPLTGLHVLKAIRTGATGAPRGTPVIVLTGHSDDSLVAAAHALDANAFLVKPVSRGAMISRIESTLMRMVELKDLGEYEAIEIPDPDETILTAKYNDGGQSAGIEQDIPRAADDKAVLVALDDIREGALLATPIKDDQGQTIVSGGATLSRELIDKLKDLHELK